MVDEIIDESKSSFNEASFKMRRLDKLQEICNISRAYPVKRDEDNNSGILNHYNALVSLYQECSSKLTPKESEEVKPKLKELHPLVRTLNKKLPKNFSDKEERKWYHSEKGADAMDDVMDKIFDVEELLRKFLDVHGFSTMNQENSEGDAYN